MKENKDIEKVFREGLQHAEAPVKASLWEGIQSGLSNAAASTSSSLASKGILKSLGAKIIAAVSTAAIATAGLYMATHSTQKTGVQKSQNISSTTTTPLAKTDDTAPILHRVAATEQSVANAKHESKSNSGLVLPENKIQEELTPPVSSAPKKMEGNATPIDSKDNSIQESPSSQNTQKTAELPVEHEDAVKQPIENKVDEPAGLNSVEPALQEMHTLDITLPNIITPNGDGKNDGLRFDLPATKQFDLQIYNAQGEQVFHSNDPHVVWSGVSSNGELLQEGRYVYKVSAETEDGQILEQKTQSLLISR